jgi:NAD(P)-dependent dehydrogenase (short-subunit alcohol dehydrogenase family)
MNRPTATRRQILQSASALGLVAVLPRCATLNDQGGGPGISPNPALFADIPLSDYGFATTSDDVVASLDLSGKTVLITGCNSGLGYESLRSMAAAGAHVIGTARTMEKAEQACSSVGGPGRGQCTPLVCELTDMESVVACAEAVNRLNTSIDILMLNAGIMALPKLEQVEVNGTMLEMQFVVNHLGHYLLTRRLLPRVAAAPAGRVVWVSSMGYSLAPAGGIVFDNLSYADGYKPFAAYGQTKLANVLTSNEISRRYADAALTSNAIHPGLVDTNLGRYMRGGTAAPEKKKDRPLRKGMKTSAQGASTQVYVATDPRLNGVSGYYFGDCNPEELKGDYARDAALAAKLWDVSEGLVSEWL